MRGVRSVLMVLIVVGTACTGTAQAPPSASAPTTPAAVISQPTSQPPAAQSVPISPVASVAIPSPSPVATAAQQPPTKIVASYSELSGDILPLWVAKEAGLFTKHGLDVDLRLIESNNSVAALLAGETQVAVVGGAAILSAAVGGADLVTTATLSPRYPYVFEAASGINSVDDLRGQRVGVSQFGSSSDVATRVALEKVGLNPDTDVNIVTVGSSQARTAAIISGALQGALAHPPENVKMEAQGAHVLFDLASLDLPNDNAGIGVKGSWVAGHREAMQGFIDAIVEAIARTKADKPFALSVIQTYYKSDDPALNEEMYSYHVDHILPVLPFPRADQFGDAVRILSTTNPRVTSFDLSRVIDPSFVQSSADRGVAQADGR